MLKFGKKKVRKVEFYDAKKQIKIWDVNFNSIIISNLVEKNKEQRQILDWIFRSYQAISFDTA